MAVWVVVRRAVLQLCAVIIVGYVGLLCYYGLWVLPEREDRACYVLGTTRLDEVEDQLRAFYSQNGRFPDQLKDLVSASVDSHMSETSKQQTITNPVTQAHFPYERTAANLSHLCPQAQGEPVSAERLDESTEEEAPEVGVRTRYAHHLLALGRR